MGGIYKDAASPKSGGHEFLSGHNEGFSMRVFQWYMTLYSGVTQRSAPITFLIGCYMFTIVISRHASWYQHLCKVTNSDGLFGFPGRWECILCCLCYIARLLCTWTCHLYMHLHDFRPFWPIYCTRKWLFVEARGTRSCIRVYGSGVLDLVGYGYTEWQNTYNLCIILITLICTKWQNRLQLACT